VAQRQRHTRDELIERPTQGTKSDDEHAVDPCACLVVDDMGWQGVGNMYIEALALFPQALPVIVPAVLPLLTLARYLEQADGVLLTGADSNVHPVHYGGSAGPRTEPYDSGRDRVALELATQALKRNMPLLGICRGCQELNVACGGALESEVHERAGRLDHRAPVSSDLALCFAPRHGVEIERGTLLHRVLTVERCDVNSLHRQAVGRLGKGVAVNARASDGVVEAISIPRAAFALGVQWHPESGVPGDALSLAVFTAFIDACEQYRARRSSVHATLPQGHGRASYRSDAKT
jgi:putative glutamine amidotransferase